MGELKPPIPVKLICGMITGKPGLFEQAQLKLQQRYGPVDYISPLMPFSCYTDYYEPEMGIDLKRQFISFEKLMDPSELVPIKLVTNKIELELGSPNRVINLDPGYITLAKLILATTKDYQHRIYLGQGIYAEVTLRFRQGKFEPYEWTYPDYRSVEYINIFNQIRAVYQEQLNQIRNPK